VKGSRQLGWRLWFVQASWNREGMQSLGLLVAALPVARGRGDEGESFLGWMSSRLGFVNTNPYLSGLLLGASLRAERDAGSTAALRLEKGLSRYLGAVGDGLFWEGLRPAFAYGGLAAGLVVGPRGVLAAWLGFALLQGLIRSWGLRAGLAHGLGIVDWLEEQGLPRAVQRAGRMAYVAIGGAIGLALLQRAGLVEEPAGLACAAAALVCGSLAAWRRWPLEWVLPGLALIYWLISRMGPGL
jgi:PTS system mannose-specific IID component